MIRQLFLMDGDYNYVTAESLTSPARVARLKGRPHIAVKQVSGTSIIEIEALSAKPVEAMLMDTASAGIDSSVVGLSGRTASALRPEGEVEVDARRLAAKASSGFIDAGQPVKVVAVEGARVVVEPRGE